MARYVVLLRGINVGGRNRVPMAELRTCLEGLGCSAVTTLLASGNVVLTSPLGARALTAAIESALPAHFALDVEQLRVLVLTAASFRTVVAGRPEGFGERPETFHSDAIFLMGITTREAMTVFRPREGVDQVWAGNGVVYSQRVSAQRTKSRLNAIVGTPQYASMTIRSWQTTLKLLAALDPG